MCECLNLHMERALATKFGHFGILYLEAAAKNYQLEMRKNVDKSRMIILREYLRIR